MKLLLRLLPIILVLLLLCCFAILSVSINPVMLGGVGAISGGKNYQRGSSSGGGTHPPGGGTCTTVGINEPDNPFRGWPVARYEGDWKTISSWFCDPDYFKGWTHWGIDLASRIYYDGDGKLVANTLNEAPVVSTALRAIVKNAANDYGYHYGMGNFVIIYHVTCSTFCGSIPAEIPEGHHYRLLEINSPDCSEVIATASPRTTPTVEFGDLIEDCAESGWKASYFHLKGTNVGIGDLVEYGDVLGWIDDSGCSTGPHLHYQINQPKELGGRAIDPAPAMCDDYDNGLRGSLRQYQGACANISYPSGD